MKLKTFACAASIAALATAVTAQDSELLVLDWSGFEEEGFFQTYIEQHGTGPSFSLFGEEEEAFQKLRSGFRADVSHPCSQSVEKWRLAGLIEPWDIDQIPNYDTVAETYKTNPIFADDTGVYFIPADFGATAMLYNSDEISEEAASSLNIFVDPALAGRTSLPDNVEDAYALAYLATGTSDWTQATQEDFERASAWMREAHANTRTYWTDSAELTQLMATGEVLVSWSWNAAFVNLLDEGHPVVFNRETEEGYSDWSCGYVNLTNGPGSEEKAHEFVNSWLDQSSTNYIVNEWGYGHANTVAMAAIDEETLDSVGLSAVEATVLSQLPMDNALREQMIQEFERIKAGF